MTAALFTLLASVTAVAGLYVVTSRDLVRAVLWLALALLGTAGLYALLDAPFLSGIQVLTYVGGVVTLMLFGVMLTRHHDGSEIATESADRLRAGVVSLAFFAVVSGAVLRTDFEALVPAEPPPGVGDTRALGRALLDDHILAFEAASVLLLAAIIGATVLVRRREPGAAPRPAGAPADRTTDRAAASGADHP